MVHANDLYHIKPQETELHAGLATGKLTQTPGLCLSRCPRLW